MKRLPLKGIFWRLNDNQNRQKIESLFWYPKTYLSNSDILTQTPKTSEESRKILAILNIKLESIFLLVSQMVSLSCPRRNSDRWQISLLSETPHYFIDVVTRLYLPFHLWAWGISINLTLYSALIHKQYNTNTYDISVLIKVNF